MRLKSIAGKTVLGLAAAQTLGAAALLCAGPSRAANPPAEEIVKKMHQAFFYQGDTLSARVKMTLTAADGHERLRDLSMLRVNMGPNSEEQRYFMYFHSPGDVRAMAFLVYKYPGKDADRWMFIPALNMVQRIAAKDASSSFVGSDFSYEDVSGRDVGSDAHKIAKEEELGGTAKAACWVIESVPKAPASYRRKLSWISKSDFLPLKEEYYDVQDQLFKAFSADEIKEIDGVATAVKRTMKNVKSGHQTVVEFTQVRYHLKLSPQTFNERALKNPPKEWIK